MHLSYVVSMNFLAVTVFAVSASKLVNILEDISGYLVSNLRLSKLKIMVKIFLKLNHK